MKFCVDCANYSPMKYSENDGICSAAEHGINLVTGVPNTRTCEAQRSYTGSPLHCGFQAVFFKPKFTGESA